MAFITTTAASISSGGTINGDLVITGDFKVEGAGSFAYDEIVEGTLGLSSHLFIVQNSLIASVNSAGNTGTSSNRIKLKNSSNGNMEFNLENSAYDYVFPDGKFGIGVKKANRVLSDKQIVEINTIKDKKLISGIIDYQKILSENRYDENSVPYKLSDTDRENGTDTSLTPSMPSLKVLTTYSIGLANEIDLHISGSMFIE